MNKVDKFSKLLFLLLSLLFMVLSPKSHGDDQKQGLFLPEGLINFSPKAFSDNALMVDKSKKKIYLFKVEGGIPKLSAEYDADLGKNSGDKVSLGDRKTPEGIYFFEKMIDGKELDREQYGALAFTTDYPNFFDRRIGKSGNGIWLHAVADKTSLDRGSKGCVVVRNDTIKILQPQIKVKYTPLMVYDQITWVPKDQFLKSQAELNRYIQDWKSAWESKRLEDYMTFYAKDFRFKKMNLKRYKAYKKYFNDHYTDIHVTLSEPQIFEHSGDMIVRFLQDYASPEHKDFGVKTLYLQKTSKTAMLLTLKNKVAVRDSDRAIANNKVGNTGVNAAEYKIIGEFWEPRPIEE